MVRTEVEKVFMLVRVKLLFFFFCIFVDPQLEGKDMSHYDSRGELKDIKYFF